MPDVRYQDLCVDAVDAHAASVFWGAALGLEPAHRRGQIWLTGPTPQHTVWINEVTEPVTVKNRVHLDVHTADVADLETLGARHRTTCTRWTVLADPDGQEFCAFVRDRPPAHRLYEINVDCTDPQAQADWWGSLFGADVCNDGQAYWWIHVPGAPFEALVFDAVPEPKSVKNRVHWDVTATSADAVVAAGATLLRERGGDLRWHVLADPEGNEFCVFDD